MTSAIELQLRGIIQQMHDATNNGDLTVKEFNRLQEQKKELENQIKARQDTK